MAGLETLEGCGTALVTPFQSDGQLDEAALADLVDFQIEEGVDFLVPCGTTGETPALDASEQLRVVEIVKERAARRVPIIVGAGGNCTGKVVAAAERFAALGVDGLLSVTPYYNKPTQEGLYQHYATLAEAVDTPIILYNVPSRTGANLLPETVLRLAELDGIAGIKEASASIAQITEIATRMPADFRLLSGDDGFVLPLIAIGGCGVISVVSNVAPRAMSEFTRLCLEGRFDAARLRQGQIHELTKACFLETNPIPAKAALAIMGKIREVYRLPMVPIGRENRKRLEEVLRREDLEVASGPAVSVA
ncbi:MAG: 4-hydroxy-tetrahydrodipicolinate synthase [Acidobacteriota bacterium]